MTVKSFNTVLNAATRVTTSLRWSEDAALARELKIALRRRREVRERRRATGEFARDVELSLDRRGPTRVERLEQWRGVELRDAKVGRERKRFRGFRIEADGAGNFRL